MTERKHSISAFCNPNSISFLRYTLSRYMFDLEKLPDGWKQYIHIDGKPYFHHEFRNTVTEEWIRYPDVFAKVNQACMEIDSIKSRRFPNLVGSKEHECYISLDPDGNHSAQYYFADHDKCSVFWLEEISDLVRLGFAKSPVRGVGKPPNSTICISC